MNRYNVLSVFITFTIVISLIRGQRLLFTSLISVVQIRIYVWWRSALVDNICTAFSYNNRIRYFMNRYNVLSVFITFTIVISLIRGQRCQRLLFFSLNSVSPNWVNSTLLAFLIVVVASKTHSRVLRNKATFCILAFLIVVVVSKTHSRVLWNKATFCILDFLIVVVASKTHSRLSWNESTSCIIAFVISIVARICIWLHPILLSVGIWLSVLTFSVKGLIRRVVTHASIRNITICDSVTIPQGLHVDDYLFIIQLNPIGNKDKLARRLISPFARDRFKEAPIRWCGELASVSSMDLDADRFYRIRGFNGDLVVSTVDTSVTIGFC